MCIWSQQQNLDIQKQTHVVWDQPSMLRAMFGEDLMTLKIGSEKCALKKKKKIIIYQN